jgi:hypothetical protein
MTIEAFPSVDAIIEGFLQKPDKIRGIPNYYMLNTLRQTLYRNANSFASTLRGGNHGYLGTLMNQPTYLQATQPNILPFTAPLFPGYLPAMQGMQAQIADQVCTHNENLQKWKEHENVTKALRKQLIDAVELPYITHLEDPYSGFNNVLVKDILHDLFENYGKIRSTNLLANNKKFDQEWDPLDTFQSVLARIKQCCDFAANTSQPYSEEQKLAKAHAIVFNTGLYYDALEKWEEVPPAQANYENFCKHMIQAQTQLQTKRTSKQQGYNLAVEHMQELTDNFCNLVTQERANKENDQATINDMRMELSTMKTLIQQLQFQNKQVPLPRNRQRKPYVDHGSYCWTHGYAVTKTHTSQNSHTKGPWHKDEATREIQWVAASKENSRHDNGGQSVKSTI